MSDKKKSFVLYADQKEVIEDLSFEEKGRLLDALFDFADSGKNPEFQDVSLLVAFKMFKVRIAHDNERYENISKKRSEAGRKHKGNQYSLLEQNGTNGTNGTNVPTLEQTEQMEQDGTNGTIRKDTNVSSIYIKEDTIVSKKDKPLWKKSYDEYKRIFEEAKQDLLSDDVFRKKQEDYYPNIDYEKSLEKGMDYWLSESTWKKVAKERVQTIQPKERLKKNFDKSKVYRSYNDKNTLNTGYPCSIDDVKNDDVNYSWDFYVYWAEKSGAYKLYDNMNGGFPENDQQYQHLLEHTIGGARAFAYVVLVFLRDGWKEYDDERGFMWIYSNYIKANGLYKE